MKPCSTLRKRYREIVWCWNGFPNGLPVFTNKFIQQECMEQDYKTGFIYDVIKFENMREQIIAVREGLAD